MNRDYDLMMIDSTDYIKNIGNEEQIKRNLYFGGGMFVAAIERLDK